MKTGSRSLWFRWVCANALAEFVGLGATFAVIGLIMPRVDARGVGGILLAFVLTVLAGGLEATLVGLAQWWAMRAWFPLIRRRAWWGATLIGALVGYVLGYLPSTLMSLGEASGETSMVEPSQWLTLLLAAALGAVAGAVLSFAQWLVLRKNVRGSGLWIPANMLAWAVGMPVIFAGMDLAFQMRAPWQTVLIIGAALLVAGTVVGAIHGSFLVRIAKRTAG